MRRMMRCPGRLNMPEQRSGCRLGGPVLRLLTSRGVPTLAESARTMRVLFGVRTGTHRVRISLTLS